MALTYYTMLDLGNILLFASQDQELRERLRLGAERLLAWQHAAGDWEVDISIPAAALVVLTGEY